MQIADNWESRIFTSEHEELPKWREYFQKLGKKGIYHNPDYIKVLEEYYYPHSISELFVYGNNHDFVYYPYFKRPLDVLPFSADKFNLSKYYDIISSWYYGGPLVHVTNSRMKRKLVNNFSNAFRQYCTTSNIISEFVRFDPNIKNHEYFHDFHKIEKNRRTVFVDLLKSDDIIWKELKGSCRRNIKKAKDKNLDIRKYKDLSDVEMFWAIYDQEMERKGSVDRLRFSFDFFRELFERLADNVDLLLIEFSGNIIGGFVVAYNNNAAHHFLSATMPQFWNMRVNDFLYYSAVLYAKKELECNIFDFQGGRKGVYRFKSKFSPSRSDFYTSSAIYKIDIYDQLVNIAEEQDINSSKNFSPQYRPMS